MAVGYVWVRDVGVAGWAKEFCVRSPMLRENGVGLQ